MKQIFKIPDNRGKSKKRTEIEKKNFQCSTLNAQLLLILVLFCTAFSVNAQNQNQPLGRWYYNTGTLPALMNPKPGSATTGITPLNATAASLGSCSLVGTTSGADGVGYSRFKPNSSAIDIVTAMANNSFIECKLQVNTGYMLNFAPLNDILTMNIGADDVAGSPTVKAMVYYSVNGSSFIPFSAAEAAPKNNSALSTIRFAPYPNIPLLSNGDELDFRIYLYGTGEGVMRIGAFAPTGTVTPMTGITAVSNINTTIITCFPTDTIKFFNEPCTHGVGATLTVTPLTGAGATVTVEGMNILYTRPPGFIGIDAVYYTYTSPSCGTFQGKLNLTVSECPDNIRLDDCVGTPSAQEWTMHLSQFSNQWLSTYQSVVVGDIDNDGISEIITAGRVTFDSGGSGHIKINANLPVDRQVDTLVIFKGNNIATPWKKIRTRQPFSWYHRVKYGIVKTRLASAPTKDTVLIVVAEADLKLRAYSYASRNRTPVWESTVSYHATDANGMPPAFCDLNHDGIPEIAIGGKLYDSRNGNLICALGVSPSSPEPPFVTDNRSMAVQIADVFGDGELKYVMGNYIYDVNTDDANNIISLTLNKKISLPTTNWNSDSDYTAATAGHPYSLEGGTPIFVDLDNDGKLEMIVLYTNNSLLEESRRYSDYSSPTDSKNYAVLYVADPETGNVLASKYFLGACNTSYPTVSDVDGDGIPEISFIKSVSYSPVDDNGGGNLIMCYRYVPGNKLLQKSWQLEHKDPSGRTGMTTFDFNLDNEIDIAYRDEIKMRIIDGKVIPTLPATLSDRNKSTFEAYSGTSQEYPVIADIDGDGQAEIIIVSALDTISGGITSTEDAFIGRLCIYKSGNPTTSPWAPTRRVWNQYAYNPTQVNEDLSIPKYPMNPARQFSNGKRPYNNYWQQQTILNKWGDPYWPAAEVVWEEEPSARLAGDSLIVTGCIRNIGQAAIKEPIYVSFYKNNTGALNFLKTDSIMKQVDAGSAYCFRVVIKNFIATYGAMNSIWFSFNDRNGIYPYQAQCYVDDRRQVKLASDIAAVTEPGVPVDMPVSYPGNDGSGSITDVKPGTHGTTSHKNGIITYTPKPPSLAGQDPWEGLDEFEFTISYTDPDHPGNNIQETAYGYVLVLKRDRITCGDNLSVHLDTSPVDGTSYNWYNDLNSDVIVPKDANGDLTVSRTDAGAQYFTERWLDIEGGPASYLFPSRIKVRFRFVPLAMKWSPRYPTAEGANDWNNPQNWVNWTSPNGLSSTPFDPALGFVPWPCTDVLIPVGLTAYPNLTPCTANSSDCTGYADPPAASCNDIWFEHGGEVVRTDSLHYHWANVELTMNANRWYMFSPPLKSMYTGDIYLTNPCPYDDGVVVYTQLYKAANPQPGRPAGAVWSGNFNTASHPMTLGLGLAIWADYWVGGQPTAITDHRAVVSNDGANKNFWFPKSDTFYKYFIEGTNTPTGDKTSDLDRTDYHRFIYEPTGSDGYFTVNVTTTGSDNYFIIGNPFMAHLDFEKFFEDEQNKTKIQKEYRLIQYPQFQDDELLNGEFPDFSIYKKLEGVGGTVTDADGIGNWIAPMQSVILTAKTAGTFSLRFHGNMTVANTSLAHNKLKVVQHTSDIITIIAGMGKQTNTTSLLYHPEASNAYIPEEDSYKLFSEIMFDDYEVTTPLLVYTYSSDGYALDVNTFGNAENYTVKLGIRTSLTGQISLDFQGIENFMPNREIYLYDRDEDKMINLRETPSYVFFKESDVTELNDRFLLLFSKETAANLNNLRYEDSILIHTEGDRLDVISNNDLLKSVEVLDLQGKLFLKSQVSSHIFTATVGRQGVYIVKAQTEKCSEIKKIIVK